MPGSTTDADRATLWTLVDELLGNTRILACGSLCGATERSIGYRLERASDSERSGSASIVTLGSLKIVCQASIVTPPLDEEW